jgi:hypothetical protein
VFKVTLALQLNLAIALGGSEMSKSATKYLALGTFTVEPTPELFAKWLPTEVPATLKLYLAGKMDQFWLREDGKGVVFVMTTETSEEAASLLKALPLGQADLLRFELIPIGPLAPLGVLVG